MQDPHELAFPTFKEAAGCFHFCIILQLIFVIDKIHTNVKRLKLYLIHKKYFTKDNT